MATLDILLSLTAIILELSLTIATIDPTFYFSICQIIHIDFECMTSKVIRTAAIM